MMLATLVILSTLSADTAAGGVPTALRVSAGYATDLTGGAPASSEGFFAEGEYVWVLASWVSARAYAGVQWTSPDPDLCRDVQPCEVFSHIGYLGARLRLMAPIPYVGPFFELGLGGSLGNLTTRFGGIVDDRFYGVTYHVPWAVGLAFGEHHQYAVELSYLQHPAHDHIAGGVGLGLTIPLSGPSRGEDE